ncbi:MAG: hypothetical protein ACM3RX_03230, partial [Methanococcaceae archaeon]
KVIYSPKLLQLSNEEVNIMKSKFVFELMYISGNENNQYLGPPKNALVFDDRVELTFKKKYIKTIYYSDLLDYTISVTQNREGADYYLIVLGNILFVGPKNPDTDIKNLADYLFYFQHKLIAQKYDSLIASFIPLASQYRELKEKPQVSEEQRKYIVQANLFNEDKQYTKAIERYLKAIETHQTSYPAAYTNLALLSAQINKYYDAIYYMKKYLLLEPEAADARNARDKIYEWEARLNL